MKKHIPLIVMTLLCLFALFFLLQAIKEEVKQIDESGGVEALIERVWKGKQD